MTDQMILSWSILGIIFAGICVDIGFIFSFRRRGRKITSLPEQGVEAQATITDCHTSLRGNKGLYLQVHYQFPLPTSGEAKGGNNLPTVEKEKVYAAGTTHTVVYLAESPSFSVLKAEMGEQIKVAQKAAQIMTLLMSCQPFFFLAVWLLLVQQKVIVSPF